MFNVKNKKCNYVCISDDNNNIKKIINIKDIYSIAKDCIFVKNKCSIELENNYDSIFTENISIINLNTYNLDGEFLGKTIDATINSKYHIDTIQLSSNNSIKNKEIFTISQNTLLINNQNISRKKFKPQNNICPQKTPIINKVNILDTSKKSTTENLKLITDYRFLLGRTITKNITSNNGEIIIKNGLVITQEVIKKATLYGRLIEIARYSEKHQ